MSLAWQPPLFARGIGDAALWNAAVALAGETVPFEGTGTAFTFALTEPPADQPWVTVFGLRPHPEPILVEIADFPFRTTFNADLAAGDLAELPEGLREALFEGVFASVRALLPPGLAAQLERRGEGLLSAFPEARKSETQWFALRLAHSNGFSVALNVACDRSLLVRSLPDLSGITTPAQELIAQRIAAPADMTLGAITLSWRELAALEPGAVVVLEEGAGATVRIRVDDRLYEFADTGKGWTCSGPRPTSRFAARTTVHKPNGHAMDGSQNLPVPTDELAPSDDLRVVIDFDLGRSMLPLSTVAKWQAGSLIELTPPQLADGVAVTIRANGDVVGTGDVVRIDERLAVRITRFALRP